MKLGKILRDIVVESTSIRGGEIDEQRYEYPAVMKVSGRTSWWPWAARNSFTLYGSCVTVRDGIVFSGESFSWYLDDGRPVHRVIVPKDSSWNSMFWKKQRLLTRSVHDDVASKIKSENERAKTRILNSTKV